MTKGAAIEARDAGLLQQAIGKSPGIHAGALHIGVSVKCPTRNLAMEARNPIERRAKSVSPLLQRAGSLL